jgi:uncharacterized membrane protein HdeD (DUF308 family)
METLRSPFVDPDSLTRNWWAVLLRGIAGILFGIFTVFAPGISLAALVLVFGAYAFVDGVFGVVSAIRGRRALEHWWMLLIVGLMGIATGVIAFGWPGITALALLYLIAAWALVIGVFEIVAAIRLRKVITGEWLLALGGIASVALGILLILYPGPGALVMILWIGAYALVAGVLLVALAFRLRSWGRSHLSDPAQRVT